MNDRMMDYLNCTNWNFQKIVPVRTSQLLEIKYCLAEC